MSGKKPVEQTITKADQTDIVCDVLKLLIKSGCVFGISGVAQMDIN